jgi:hypothetical protein
MVSSLALYYDSVPVVRVKPPVEILAPRSFGHPDLILVWRLDRWGRSLLDLIN